METKKLLVIPGMPPPERPDEVDGRSWTFNFYGCQAHYEHPLKEALDRFVEMAKFTIDGKSVLHRREGELRPRYYHVGLLESHLHIDWWSERSGGLQITLHVCFYSRDNTDRARKLIEFLHGYFLPRKWNEVGSHATPI